MLALKNKKIFIWGFTRSKVERKKEETSEYRFSGSQYMFKIPYK